MVGVLFSYKHSLRALYFLLDHCPQFAVSKKVSSLARSLGLVAMEFLSKVLLAVAY